MLWALVLVGATIGVHVEIASELPTADRDAVLGLISDALQQSGHHAVRESAAPKLCPTDSSCVAGLRKRLKAEEILLARIIGGASRVRVTLTRVTDNKPVRADLDQDRREEWPQAISGAIAELYPPPPKIEPVAKPVIEPEKRVEVANVEATPPPLTTGVTLPVERSTPMAAYGSWAAAGVFTIVAVALFASAASAKADHEDNFIRNDDGRIVNVSFEDSEAVYDSIDLRNNLGVGSALLAAGLAGLGAYFYLEF